VSANGERTASYQLIFIQPVVGSITYFASSVASIMGYTVKPGETREGHAIVKGEGRDWRPRGARWKHELVIFSGGNPVSATTTCDPSIDRDHNL
jgi:hypothetical protein